MSEDQLRGMVHHASHFCQRCFALRGEIAPMWHYVTSSGEQFLELQPPGNKDVAMAMIRVLFDLHDAVRYVYMGEAWTLTRINEPIELDRHGGIAEHPDRIEIVQLQGEDATCGTMIAQHRIIRPANCKPHLAPLEIIVDPSNTRGLGSEGRMVGVLPVRGTRQ
jgi:hypothetical protein